MLGSFVSVRCKFAFEHKIKLKLRYFLLLNNKKDELQC